MNKRDIKRAFRAAMALEFAAVPATEDAVTYSFTQGFCNRMDALIAERKRGSWRLLRKRARRVLVAAVLAVLLALLVACSPKLRMVVKDFVVSFTDRDADYFPNMELRDEIEQLYWLDPPPDGFVLTEQRKLNAAFCETLYHNEVNAQIILSQRCALSGTAVDTEGGEVNTIRINGYDVVVWTSDQIFQLSWVQEGYWFDIICLYTDGIPHEQLIAAVQVMDAEVADG